MDLNVYYTITTSIDIDNITAGIYDSYIDIDETDIIIIRLLRLIITFLHQSDMKVSYIHFVA